MSDRCTTASCDLCGCSQAVEVPHCREYTGDQPISICVDCGFVYVRQRRSSESVARSWSDQLFGNTYTGAIPAVQARQVYVADFLHANVPVRGRTVMDIGAGEGHFLDRIRREEYGASVYGVEPSAANCTRMRDLGIDCFNGTIEQFCNSAEFASRMGWADVVTVMWTLENCEDCNAMIQGARRCLKDGGHLAVATGSRLLVPFKKPLHYYLGRNPADTHCFRFSANTLQGALARNGIETAWVNRYLDNDILCVIGRISGQTSLPWDGDDYLDVVGFFERWHVETQMYYRDL